MDLITKALLKEFVGQHSLSDLPESRQFEHFCAFSVISSRYTEEFSTSDAVVGDGGDLGVDAYAIIVNGRLVDDDQVIDDLLKLNGYLEVEFIFVQAKRSPNFDGGAILTLCENIKNAVFGDDEGIPKNEDIEFLILLVRKLYSAAEKFRGNPECRIYYVTTGTWVNDPYLVSIKDRQIKEIHGTNMFSSVRFVAVGAQELQTLYRNTKYSITRSMQFEKFVLLPPIAGIKASYLGVMPALEFIKLITDEDGNIIKSTFIDNVRDFQGDNRVNQSIKLTIDGGYQDQFVLRNNGVTIVVRDLSITSQTFTLRDYQIVNGCQTSHVLYLSRSQHTTGLLVPVKLIYTDDDDVTQEIIKSTNNQTPIDENDLLALTKFQRDLETYYAGFDEDRRLFYERRSKQYAQMSGIDKLRIIPIGVQLKVFASMFLEAAHQAGRYQATLLKSVEDRVFKSAHRQEPYYTAALAYYRFDSLLKRGYSGTSDLRSFKFHFLPAFRFRYETFSFPGFGNKSLAEYCDGMNRVLWDVDATKAAFDECADIIRRAAGSKGLKLVRDAAKVRDLTDGIREIAMSENPRNRESSVGG